MSAEIQPNQDYARTGPGTLAGTLMRSFWQPVGLSDDLKPGYAHPIRVMGEDFTLYRGEGGAPHVIAGRCPHRGTQLSLGWVEGDSIRCFYHGWKYDQTGQCVEQAMEKPGFARDVCLATYPVYEHLGLIFAYFGGGEPPEQLRYLEYETADVVVDAATNMLPYNFFQNMENSVDTLHVSWVHRRSNFFADGRTADFGKGSGSGAASIEGIITECWAEETDYGFLFYDRFENGKVKTSYFEMPNILHVKVYPVDVESGWRDYIAWKVPIDDESYNNFNLTVAFVGGEAAKRYREHPQSPQNIKSKRNLDAMQKLGDEILAGRRRLTVEDCGDLAHSVNLQDYVAQKGQGVIVDRRNEWLAESDKVVVMLRRLWRREMTKISNGDPLKKWRRNGYIEITTGLE